VAAESDPIRHPMDVEEDVRDILGNNVVSDDEA
jgi:hypothetical protein